MELMVILVLSAAVLMSLTVFIGMLLFALAIAKLVNAVNTEHLSDMRYHMTRMTDQVLAISEANLIEIQGRRDAEIDRVKAEGSDALALLRRASGANNGAVPRVDREFDHEYDMGGGD